jgi:transmembrane sensor
MDKSTDWDKILRYLSGECTFEEELELLDWMNMNPENEEFIHFLEMIWQMEPSRKKDINSETAWERFNERYHFNNQAPDTDKKIGYSGIIDTHAARNRWNRQRQYWYRFAGLAASFIIVITAVWIYTSSITESVSEITEEIQYREIRTEKGQRSRIILNEGSVIHLNGDSYLRLPASFSPGEDRVVYLEGEAFFEITRDDNIRFQVIAAESVTTVLGTRFNVRSYKEDPDVTVVVADGMVSVGYINHPAIEPAILTRNQKGVIGRGYAPVISDVTDLSIYHGWTQGELVFEQEELSQMISKLERWFGIDIEMLAEEGAFEGRRLTASFSERQPAEDVLQSISLVLGLSIERTDTSANTYKLINKQ